MISDDGVHIMHAPSSDFVFCCYQMRKWIPVLFLLAVCNRGFGVTEIYELAVSSYLGLYASLFIKERQICSGLLFLILFLLSICTPSVFLLWGTTAAILFLSERRLLLVPLLFWLSEAIGFMPATYLQITLCFITFTCIARYSSRITRQYVLIGLTVLIVAADIYQYQETCPNAVIEDRNYNVYGQGKTFQRISGCKVSKNYSEGERIIRNKSYGTKIPDSVPGVVIYDIDLQKEDCFATNQRLQQRTPWNSKLYIGNQYLLESILADGALFSNIGITLKSPHNSKAMLSRPVGLTHSIPLILLCGKTLFLNDSDYMSSYIANYQKNLIHEIVGGNSIHRIAMHLLNILCLTYIVCMFLIEKKRTRYKIAFTGVWIMLVVTLVSLANELPQEGEIRMVGEIRNSHENDGFDGVPKMINANGYPFITGNKNAKILVVKRGEKAKWKGESLIVAEPDAKIGIMGHNIKIDDMPLGMKGGIIDGRNIIVDDSAVGVICEINGVTIVGTGSPAKLQWKRFVE